jgi:hypothetical protein
MEPQSPFCRYTHLKTITDTQFNETSWKFIKDTFNLDALLQIRSRIYPTIFFNKICHYWGTWHWLCYLSIIGFISVAILLHNSKCSPVRCLLFLDLTVFINLTVAHKDSYCQTLTALKKRIFWYQIFHRTEWHNISQHVWSHTKHIGKPLFQSPCLSDLKGLE